VPLCVLHAMLKSYSWPYFYFIVSIEIMVQVMGAYGYLIEHILMVDIIPDDTVRKAMNEINAGTPYVLSFLVLLISCCRI